MRKINGKRSEKMDRRRGDRWRESFSRIEFCSQGSRKEFDPKMERTLFEEGRNFVRRRSKKSKKRYRVKTTGIRRRRSVSSIQEE